MSAWRGPVLAAELEESDSPPGARGPGRSAREALRSSGSTTRTLPPFSRTRRKRKGSARGASEDVNAIAGRPDTEAELDVNAPDGIVEGKGSRRGGVEDRTVVMRSGGEDVIVRMDAS